MAQRGAINLFRQLVLIASVAVVSAGAEAQIKCVTTHLAKLEATNSALGIALSDAEQMVSQIEIADGTVTGVIVVPCSDVEKVSAIKPGADNKRFILYNERWVREVLGPNQAEAAFLFGHELGHFQNDHWGANAGLTRIQKETQADQSGGCAVAHLKLDGLTMEGLVWRIRQDTEDGMYPSVTASLAAARAGFSKCGGTRAKRSLRPSMGGGPTLLGASLLAETEGFLRTVTGNSPPMIGYGHRLSSEDIEKGVIAVFGARIELNRPITEAEGMLLLYEDLSLIADTISSEVRVPLTDPQRAALESFIFNVGTSRFKSSALLTAINNRKFDEVPKYMSTWSASSRGSTLGLSPTILAALQRRRDRELGMWLSGS